LPLGKERTKKTRQGLAPAPRAAKPRSVRAFVASLSLRQGGAQRVCLAICRPSWAHKRTPKTGVAKDLCLTSGELAPIVLDVATPTTTLSVTNNAVNLPTGYYMVTYNVEGTSTDAIDLLLELNGTTLSSIVSTAGDIDASRTLLINATTPSTLTLVNNGTSDITNSDVGITVTRLY
jgi:hypothetical protein